jgi:phosphopantothenoylcysteine decarboxylase/phosphopantothenate--cysteine ligase
MRKRILITAGPTREPIDPVRFISNHSSGTMGLALASAALEAGHDVTLILGPVAFEPPGGVSVVRVQTTQEMHDAVMEQMPLHELLIMAAAVADYRPTTVAARKLGREKELTLALEPTPDIVAAAAAARKPWQAVVGFSLESAGDIDRAKAKLERKDLDLIVFNPLETMNSAHVTATLIYRGGRMEPLPQMTKALFARHLIGRAVALSPLR